MKKGVSPIIATLLVLLIAIALGGSFYVFSTKTFQDVSENTESEIGRASEGLSSSLRIESVANDDIFIRNTGSRNIDMTKIVVFLDGGLGTITSTTSPDTPANILDPDEIGTVTISLSGKCDDQRHTIKISATNTEDSTAVTITSACKMVFA